MDHGGPSALETRAPTNKQQTPSCFLLPGKHSWPATLPTRPQCPEVFQNFHPCFKRPSCPHQYTSGSWHACSGLQSLARVTVPISEPPASQKNIPSASVSLTGANPALWIRGGPLSQATASKDLWNVSCGSSTLSGQCRESRRRRKCPR